MSTPNLARLMTAIGRKAGVGEFRTNVRRMVALAASLTPAGLANRILEIEEKAEKHAKISASLVSPEELEAGKAGPFDAADLRYWLLFARKAGVEYVPAREIAAVSPETVDAVIGGMTLPDTPVVRRFRRNLQQAVARLASDHDPEKGTAASAQAPDRESAIETLSLAMDDIPEGWMVRHVRCGSTSSKTIMGTGTATEEDLVAGIDLAPQVRIGPGWIMLGNRRMIDVADPRFLSVGMAPSPSDIHRFVARPWVKTSRTLAGIDPHRDGSPFPGEGTWPAEWRAFVRNGVVEAVSAYYPWAHQATPEDAFRALEVRRTAERVVAAARTLGALPASIDIELARGPATEARLADYPPDGLHATVDFIETENGPVLLEGGPAFTPIGGGHPCGFTGLERPEGAALGLAPGLNPADPATWRGADRAGVVLTWEETERHALGYSPHAAARKGPQP